MRYVILWFSLIIFLLGTVKTQAQATLSFKQVLYYRDNEIWQFNPATNAHILLFTMPQTIHSIKLSQDEQYIYVIEGEYRPATRNRSASRIFIPTGARELLYEREGITAISPNFSNSLAVITYYIDEYNGWQCLLNMVTNICSQLEEIARTYPHGDTIFGIVDDTYLGTMNVQNLTYDLIDLPENWGITTIKEIPETNKVLLFMVYKGGDTYIFNQIFTLDLQTNAIEPFRIDGYYNTIEYSSIYLWDATPNWQYVAYVANFLVVADGNDGHIINEWQDRQQSSINFLAWLNNNTLFFAPNDDFAIYSMGDENYSIVYHYCECRVFAVRAEPIVPRVASNQATVLSEERP